MAWTVERTDRRGRRVVHVQWREGGRVRSQSTGTSDPRLVAVALAQAEKREREARKPTGSAVTTEQAVEGFLAHVRCQVASPAALAFVDGKMRRVVSAMNGAPLAEWSSARLRDWLAARDLAPRTVQMLLGVGRRFVRWAHAEGLLVPDFVGSLKAPRVRPRDLDTLGPDQLQALLAAAAGHRWLELPVALAARGLSYGDLRRLDWGDVDLEAGLIAIRRAKTGEAIRLPVLGGLRELLAARRREAGPVCAGMPRSRSSATKALHRLCDRAGVPRGGWHRLRHSYGTLLAREGVDVATIGRLLGHRPGSTVTLRYIHSADLAARSAATRVEARLDGDAPARRVLPLG